MRSSRRHVRPNNVVVQHPSHRVALLLDPFHHVRRTQQALLFTRDRRKQHRRAKPAVHLRVFAQQPRALHAYRYSRSIIIRARRILGGIHNVFKTRHRIEMPGNQEDRLREFFVRPWQNSVNIFEWHRFSASPLRGHLKFIHHHLQLPAGRSADRIEPRLDVIPRASRAAFRIVPRRKRQPRPASHKFRNQRTHSFLIHRLSRNPSRRPRRNLHRQLPTQRLRRIMAHHLLPTRRLPSRGLPSHTPTHPTQHKRRRKDRRSAAHPNRFWYETHLSHHPSNSPAPAF